MASLGRPRRRQVWHGPPSPPAAGWNDPVEPTSSRRADACWNKRWPRADDPAGNEGRTGGARGTGDPARLPRGKSGAALADPARGRNAGTRVAATPSLPSRAGRPAIVVSDPVARRPENPGIGFTRRKEGVARLMRRSRCPKAPAVPSSAAPDGRLRSTTKTGQRGRAAHHSERRPRQDRDRHEALGPAPRRAGHRRGGVLPRRPAALCPHRRHHGGLASRLRPAPPRRGGGARNAVPAHRRDPGRLHERRPVQATPFGNVRRRLQHVPLRGREDRPRQHSELQPRHRSRLRTIPRTTNGPRASAPASTVPTAAASSACGPPSRSCVPFTSSTSPASRCPNGASC